MDLNSIMNDLIGISKEKCRYLEEIYVLTEGQTAAIKNESMDDLNDLIAGKQLKIDHIKELDIQFEGITDQIKKEFQIKSLSELKCENAEILQDEIRNIYAVLRKINEVEKENSAALNERKDELHDKISHTNKGKIAMMQYSGGSNYMDAVFFDKKIK
ncbi:MAG: flagellar export chaperone FlgN [Clostridia bacterium]|nr:flagellar export chaperone FlgN [Clostridia bacterium]